MPFSRFLKITASERYDDILSAGGIVLYCLAYAAMRLLISPSMELSEAERRLYFGWR